MNRALSTTFASLSATLLAFSAHADDTNMPAEEIGKLPPIERPLKDECINIARAEAAQSGDKSHIDNPVRERLFALYGDLEQAGVNFDRLDPETRLCANYRIAVQASACGKTINATTSRITRKEEGLQTIYAANFNARNLGLDVSPELLGGPEMDELIDTETSDLGSDYDGVIGTGIHEYEGHIFLSGLGFRAASDLNLDTRERLIADWLGEAYSLANTIRVEYKNGLEHGDMSRVEDLRSRVGSDDMVSAFLGSMEVRPDDYESAMRAAITAYAGQGDVMAASHDAMLEEIRDKDLFERTNVPAQSILGEGMLMKIGDMGEDGNFMTPEFMDFIRQSISETQIAQLQYMNKVSAAPVCEAPEKRPDIQMASFTPLD